MKNYTILDYPKDHLVRLIVDGALLKKEKGFKAFDDREPGCISAAMNGLAYALTYKQGEPLSRELIDGIAERCMGINYFERKHLAPGTVRHKKGPQPFTFFDLGKDKVTVDGLAEFLEEYEASENKDQAGYLVFNQLRPDAPAMLRLLPVEGQALGACGGTHHTLTMESLGMDDVKDTKTIAERFLSKANESEDRVLTYCTPPSSEVSKILDSIIESYNGCITKATDSTSKLLVIAKHVQAFERLHPYYDCNGRIFVNSLLNRLLADNDFPPATFADPNVFDFLSVRETAGKIQEAMSRSVQLIENPKLELDGLKINKLKKNEVSLLTPGSETLVEALNQRQAAKHTAVVLPEEKEKKSPVTDRTQEVDPKSDSSVPIKKSRARRLDKHPVHKPTTHRVRRSEKHSDSSVDQQLSSSRRKHTHH